LKNKHAQNTADPGEPDYETVGAKILASHARDEMQSRVKQLRHCLKSAFSLKAADHPRQSAEASEADD
jgi:hypothetical protein